MPNDLRPQIERLIDEGASMKDIEAKLDGLTIGCEERDALWCWAHAYIELRPRSIFARRRRVTNSNASRTPVVH